MHERLQKFLSQAGVASRRKAEELILQGRVSVNGKIVKELGSKVDPVADFVEVNGKAVAAKTVNLYIVLNKPSGYVSSREGQFGRPTVYDFLPKAIKYKVWSVGRLDYDTDGLLIFTNDGNLTQKLTHPSFEHEKEYKISLNKNFESRDKDKLAGGVIVDKTKTYPAKVKVINPKTIKLTIHEGRNRQIRKMFESLGYKIIKLTRERLGRLRLEELKLKTGKIRTIQKNDII
ncbi:MAG: hypothetical protein A3J48_04605 [Candidatus Doudnabacteria bacterium RIFCSPHIGHO2_02_FULL_46_11]|uniref:Pseudouridine synthase n=1 Tax=Candidatus Doudnabacteria bacterium RIFCSPHIGHO2_02_FULL_46_11 TaxID=1817832 RepID=A0A1F5P7F9_9BACT|nr:MAG: hypothetical protein A3J48_04605 [Candidatus Doudnabacteria bacterium RIFCSPHIGHO2_02_FULL_46_11]